MLLFDQQLPYFARDVLAHGKHSSRKTFLLFLQATFSSEQTYGAQSVRQKGPNTVSLPPLQMHCLHNFCVQPLLPHSLHLISEVPFILFYLAPFSARVIEQILVQRTVAKRCKIASQCQRVMGHLLGTAGLTHETVCRFKRQQTWRGKVHPSFPSEIKSSNSS